MGGTSGIGKAVAEHFAKAGNKVTIVGTRDGGAQVAAAIGEGVTFYRVDVSDEEQVKDLFAELDDGKTGVDVLVNSAGVYIGNDSGGVLNLEAEDFEREWRVNTLGTFLACKYVMPLLKRVQGNIVNVVSISATQSDRFSIGYTSSKAASAMLTKSLALAHVQDGIRINAVCPGPIDTSMLAASFGGKTEGNPEYEEWIADNPMKRCGTVQDVVRGVAYLTDPENVYVTGTLLTIDGGWTAEAL